MPLRSEKALVLGLSLYAILILGSQATMSIGIAVLLVFATYAFGGPRAFWDRVRDGARLHELKKYLRATHALTAACLISLIVAKVHPISLDGQTPDVRFVKDMWKAWYFYWPLVLVPCLLALSPDGRRRVYSVYLVAFAVVAAIGC